MKKILCLALSLILAMSFLSIGAYATSSSEMENNISSELEKLDLSELPSDTYQAVIEAAQYAYMSLDEVEDDALKEEVLAAREVIIFSQSWSTDGKSGVYDGLTGEIHMAPLFYDLFPSDWDVPDGGVVGDTTTFNNSFDDTSSTVSPADTGIGTVVKTYTTNLNNPSDTVSTSNFDTYKCPLLRGFPVNLRLFQQPAYG